MGNYFLQYLMIYFLVVILLEIIKEPTYDMYDFNISIFRNTMLQYQPHIIFLS